MRPEVLCGLLAEDERLRAFAAVVLGAATPSAVAELTGLNARDAVRALRRLEQGGLISSAGGGLVADGTAFKEAVREYPPDPVPDEPLDPDQQKAAVLRAFIRDGRLVGIPVARAKRLVVLEHLAAAFEPGQRYPEGTVNAILRAWHHDYASLRRYLIDEELLSRENGVYWRTGGYVDVA
ncbi:MAG: DUF2087 domain-containing protein [Micromonosporaceae bacterium]|nr:DUF2087 domain-containing protein [Micromonosporaceae bacterium]